MYYEWGPRRKLTKASRRLFGDNKTTVRKLTISVPKLPTAPYFDFSPLGLPPELSLMIWEFNRKEQDFAVWSRRINQVNQYVRVITWWLFPHETRIPWRIRRVFQCRQWTWVLARRPYYCTHCHAENGLHKLRCSAHTIPRSCRSTTSMIHVCVEA